jgi:hypothetical protein
MPRSSSMPIPTTAPVAFPPVREATWPIQSSPTLPNSPVRPMGPASSGQPRVLAHANAAGFGYVAPESTRDGPTSHGVQYAQAPMSAPYSRPAKRSSAPLVAAIAFIVSLVLMAAAFGVYRFVLLPRGIIH